MSKTTNRETSPRDRGSVDDRLARLLDAPFLARVVPHLPPEALHRLIQSRGLDACAELVTAATPAQLTSLLDLDLWRPAQAGRDEQFDVDRFGEWLDALVDVGDSVAARTVAALDAQLVVAGLSRYMRVFDPGTFEPTESSDDEPMDRHEMMSSETSTDVVECEVGGYLVRGRRTDAWDAIVALLVALETEHHSCFHAVMQGCRRLSHSRPEVDGLDDLLMAPEQHLHDLAIEREHRRSQRGYATPGDARAFLRMARQPKASPGNPIVTAYFRAAEEADTTRDTASSRQSTVTNPRALSGDSTHGHTRNTNDVPQSIDAVVELLSEAGLMPEPPRALIGASEQESGAAGVPVLKRLMEFAAHHDEAAYLARHRELAFLANTLLAGSSVQSRSFTLQEASDAAACICNLGLECWPPRWPEASSPQASSSGRSGSGGSGAVLHESFLVDRDLVAAFEVGWSVLYHDVSLFVADQLASILEDLVSADADTYRELAVLRRTLVEQRKAGTPWVARDAADVLATLDPTAWIGVLGLLDECPMLPAALTAILERRTTPVSPTAFDFISTTAQIGQVRLFIRMLPGLLG